MIAKIVHDPIVLRLLLEALIAEDLNRRNKSLDITQVLSEPEMSLTTDATFIVPKADRSTQEVDYVEEELTAEQLDFFGDGI